MDKSWKSYGKKWMKGENIELAMLPSDMADAANAGEIDAVIWIDTDPERTLVAYDHGDPVGVYMGGYTAWAEDCDPDLDELGRDELLAIGSEISNA